MADLLEISSRIIDSGVADEPVNRVTQELSEVAEGIAVVESFSHVVALRTHEGLVVFDSSGVATGSRVVESLRKWSTDPIEKLVYTHGHLDHVGGSPAFLADAAGRRHPRPEFVAHHRVRDRFDRYRMTDGWNLEINLRQFGWLRNTDLRIGAGQTGELATASGSSLPLSIPSKFLPDDVAAPDVTYSDHYDLHVGDLEIELHHGQGETDDHTWAWIPSRQANCCGDFLIWNFPNAGNPQKVQRYPKEWARSLRQMAVLRPQLLLPAHGLPIGGADRISRVLLEVAQVLEDLVDRTVAMMNGGATLDDIIHSVRVPDDTLAIPYLRPLYDEPEFVVRNVWRLYGGWWDANPARLKPPPDRDLAREVAALAGGARELSRRARVLAQDGDLGTACQLAEWAVQAEPDDKSAHETRAAIYEQRHRSEKSLMAKGIFASAARESRRESEE
jgi:alkyl sulfatase BDS1-like metallo-beta-lactamase superfamily hydrolase